MRFLIVGLGNIGEDYTNTRHNVGFLIIDKLSQKNGFSFESKRYAFIAKDRVKNRLFYFIKPTTFMNNSGKAVRYWVNFLKLPLSNILIIVDDIALPLGRIRLRAKGGDGGHNGLHDIIYYLGSDEFPRLRFGIGDQFSKGRKVRHVLGGWNEDEYSILNNKIDLVHEAIKSFAFDGIAKSMSIYNQDMEVKNI